VVGDRGGLVLSEESIILFSIMMILFGADLGHPDLLYLGLFTGEFAFVTYLLPRLQICPECTGQYYQIMTIINMHECFLWSAPLPKIDDP